MRILYFSQDYTPHDHRILRALSRREHQVLYLRLQSGAIARESRPIPGEVQVVHWRADGRRLRGLDWPVAVRGLKRALQDCQPEVVHAGPVQLCAFLTALAGFRPLVTMSWGWDLLRDARRGLGRLVAGWTLRRSQAFIADCQAVRQVAVRLGMMPERITLLPWGADLDHFQPGDPGPLRRQLGWESAYVVLSTRSWERQYGIDVLIQGFIMAARECPQLRLLMLGAGSMAADLQARIKSAGLGDKVHLAGHVGHAQLPQHYRSADLYVSASRVDGSSVSLLEAMAIGLPASVSDIPGNCEWIEHGLNGWRFRDGDPQALAQALVAACGLGAAGAALGGRARQTVEQRADWSANSGKLFEVYRLAQSAIGAGA